MEGPSGHRGGYRGGGRGGYRGGGRAGGWDDGGGGRGWDHGGGGRRRGYEEYRQENDWRDDSGYQQQYKRGGGQGGGYEGRGGYSGGRGYQEQYHQGGRYDSPRGGGGGRYPPGGGRQHTWGGRGGGRGYRDRPPQPRVRDTLPDDVKQLTSLQPAHKRTITAMEVDVSTQLLYTGSQDGHVKAWSCADGKVTSDVDVGGEVGCMFIGHGYLIVGCKQKEEGLIKVWNLATSAHHTLPGHRGQVQCLAVAGSMLFSGGQDGSIRIWTFNDQAGMFVFTDAWTVDRGNGHRLSVTALYAYGGFLFSGDMGGMLKVWDLNTGTCSQTIVKAHGSAITSFLVWETALLSGGVDGYVKCWKALDAPAPGAVLQAEPEFSFDQQDDSSQQQQGQRRAPVQRETDGVLKIHGCADGAGKPVLVVSNINEMCARLYELPTFESRGVLPQVPEARAFATFPGGILISGDRRGEIKIFQFAAVAASPGT